jgi:methyl coenzyme M reductase subunit C
MKDPWYSLESDISGENLVKIPQHNVICTHGRKELDYVVKRDKQLHKNTDIFKIIICVIFL